MKHLCIIFLLLIAPLAAWADDVAKCGLLFLAEQYEQAFPACAKVAEQGDANAQLVLGVMYDNGRGVKQDDAVAVKWYRKAAEQGNVEAQHNLGVMYANGQGVKQDFAEAGTWYRKAAEQGFAAAQNNLGVMYANGRGVKQDFAEAVKWYRKAAEQGDANAQYNFGAMYDNGQGVKQDNAEAAKWYRKAAEQGYANAQYGLGLMYANGRGVKLDFAEAEKWYRKAAEQGYAKAQLKLEALEMLSCIVATTALFGAKLMCANRDTLMAAVKKAGATVKQEDKGKWGDTYYSSSLLKGSSELYIGYTVDDRFSVAQYTFPSHVDTQQVLRIKNMVAGKYGQPQYATGNVNLGEASFKWHLKDGIELKVSRGWPSTTTYLTYTYPKNYKLMKDEQERQRKEREKKENAAQGNAF